MHRGARQDIYLSRANYTDMISAGSLRLPHLWDSSCRLMPRLSSRITKSVKNNRGNINNIHESTIYLRYHILVIFPPLSAQGKRVEKGGLAGWETNLGMSHLLLQLQDPKHQRLASRRTPRDVNVDRNNAVTPAHDAIRVVIIPATICTTAHRHHPPRVGHLVVHLPQRGGHLIRQRSRNNHHVRLTRGRAEDYPQPVLVVAGGGQVHHFNRATGEAECHWPDGALASPVCNLVNGGPNEREGESMLEFSEFGGRCFWFGPKGKKGGG